MMWSMGPKTFQDESLEPGGKRAKVIHFVEVTAWSMCLPGAWRLMGLCNCLKLGLQPVTTGASCARPARETLRGVVSQL